MVLKQNRRQLGISGLGTIITAFCAALAALGWAVKTESDGLAVLATVAFAGLFGGSLGWLTTGTRNGFWVGCCLLSALTFLSPLLLTAIR